MALSEYPAGVDDSHPHFHAADLPDQCPDCGAEVGDDVYCEACGAVLDPDEADAIARDEAYERGEW